MKLTTPILTSQEYPEVPEGLLRTLNDLVAQLRASDTSGVRGFQATASIGERQAFPVQVKNLLDGPPAGVVVIGATDITSGQPAAVGGVAWSLSGNQVHVNGVDGLTPGHAYTLSLLILGR